MRSNEQIFSHEDIYSLPVSEVPVHCGRGATPGDVAGCACAHEGDASTGVACCLLGPSQGACVRSQDWGTQCHRRGFNSTHWPSQPHTRSHLATSKSPWTRGTTQKWLFSLIWVKRNYPRHNLPQGCVLGPAVAILHCLLMSPARPPMLISTAPQHPNPRAARHCLLVARLGPAQFPDPHPHVVAPRVDKHAAVALSLGT
jgi:hypothetical protein